MKIFLNQSLDDFARSTGAFAPASGTTDTTAASLAPASTVDIGAEVFSTLQDGINTSAAVVTRNVKIFIMFLLLE
jgi:hypothetical protein